MMSQNYPAINLFLSTVNCPEEEGKMKRFFDLRFFPRPEIEGEEREERRELWPGNTIIFEGGMCKCVELCCLGRGI